MAAAGPSPPVAAESVHGHLSRAASILFASASSLRNHVSSHKVKNPISFQSLESFCLNATKPGGAGASQLYLASLDGGPVISARLKAEPELATRGGKKRVRDDAADRAEATCAKLMRMSNGPSKPQVLLAQKTVEQLLRNVRGPSGEDIFEACGVSIAPLATTAGVVGRPRLIIACRLSAGVPLSLKTLRMSLGECFKDGMITTKPEELTSEFQLPLTETGRVVENAGQRSMLLFAAVPEKDGSTGKSEESAK
jgi:hypothetical protein